MEEQKSAAKRSFFIELAIYVVCAVLFVIFIPKYVMERISVYGPSMENNYYEGDQILAEKLSVRMGRLKRYDVIFFHPLGDREVDEYIKRIIGLPGDDIYIEDSVIYVNGQPLDEDFGAEPEFEAYSAYEQIHLASDEYFVMGDNRNNSTDSRSTLVGPVKKEDIEGRAVLRIWPLNRFGFVN